MEILGVDIGGSGIKGAPVDTATGQLLAERFRIATPKSGTPRALAKTLKTLVQHFQWNGLIGCGFPAVVQNGIAKTASNIDNKWIESDVVGLFTEATNCKTWVVNDADAAGLAEMKFGAGREQNGIVMLLTIGTGIGSAMFTGGRLVSNTELGHIYLNGEIAEDYASDAVRKKLDLTWKKWGKRFDKYLRHVENIFWPDLIIIGGGMSKRFDKFKESLSVKTTVVPAQLLNDAGIIGAALFAESVQNTEKGSIFHPENQ
jgi:polyphosphate glucokinase